MRVNERTESSLKNKIKIKKFSNLFTQARYKQNLWSGKVKNLIN
jgi:hypothetical protein